MGVSDERFADDPLFPQGGGAIGAAMRGFAWYQTPLGPPQTWPASLKALVAVMPSASQPMVMAWGPERTWLYKDAFTPHNRGAPIWNHINPRALTSDAPRNLAGAQEVIRQMPRSAPMAL